MGCSHLPDARSSRIPYCYPQRAYNGCHTVKFSPDSETLASGSWDGTILLWEFASLSSQAPWDVNNDGVVNILDLTFVASRFGQDSPDLNDDGIVNILDMTIVAQHLESKRSMIIDMLSLDVQWRG